jgi:Flp pilus assembly protein TadB
VFVKKAINACNELREKLKNIRREKRNRLFFAVGFCVVAGIVTSQFLIIGFAFWLFIAFVFVCAIIVIYSGREARINQSEEKFGCEN